MRSIEEASIEQGTIVLVRVDWNVPVKDGQVLDTSRIEVTLPTINSALNRGAKVILMSHFGNDAESFEPVFLASEKFFPNARMKFVRDPWNASSPDGEKAIRGLCCGEIAVFENLRLWMEKENDDDFAQKLAVFGDIYVNEAFPVSHREHTSIVKLPRLLPHFAGFHFLEEYQKLSEAFNPEHPFLVILGGAKFETKLPLVEKFSEIADHIFIGGALAAKAAEMDIADNPKIIFPVGDIAALDANSETLSVLEEKIKAAKFILWNGPLGNYEKGFIAGTTALARLLAESGAKVIAGGGDTENMIDDLGVSEKFYFISLAGGAMLDFLAKGTLPGIRALE